MEAKPYDAKSLPCGPYPALLEARRHIGHPGIRIGKEPLKNDVVVFDVLPLLAFVMLTLEFPKWLLGPATGFAEGWMQPSGSRSKKFGFTLSVLVRGA